MKKILLFASAFALLTGCSKLEQAPESPVNQKVDGIVFQANLDAETKGELYQDEVTKMWKMFWYAEADKMSVFYANIDDPAEPAPTWAYDEFKSYTATRTLGEGYFTATDQTDKIEFPAGENLSFRFVYPSTVAAVNPVDGNQLQLTLPAIATQTQAKLNGSDAVAKILMVGKLDNVAPKNENNPAVSDNLVGMQLTRPFPVAFFTFKNYDHDLYGDLTSIKLESKGTIVDPTAENITYENSSMLNYGSTKKYNLETGEITGDATGEAASLTVTVGEEWKDGAPVFMTMNLVDRSKNTKAEWMEITYTFANATFKELKPLGVKTSFEAHKLYDMSQGGFDLAAADYVVLGTTDATLLLNKSFDQSIESLVVVDAGTGKINDVSLASITKIVANVALSDADFAYVGEKFTALAEVTLNENTAIPAFKAAQSPQTITKLIAPKVAVINEKAFEGMTMNLTHCILPKYDFIAKEMNDNLLKAANLTHLDISSVEKIATTFPASGLSLQDFTALVEVTVKPGANVGTKAFDGCTNLAEIKFPAGTVGASINLTGEYAFAGCALTEISISNTDIPAGTFSGCVDLESVTLAGKAIVPTTIGAEAFKGTKLVDIDLSKTTKIGASAFEGCKSLKGAEQPNGVFVLFVDGITELNDNTFNDCEALRYISFANVETVGNGFLAETTCIEVSFAKPIKTTKAYANTSFGSSANDITLYVARGQEGVAGTKLTLNSAEVTFKAIKN